MTTTTPPHNNDDADNTSRANKSEPSSPEKLANRRMTTASLDQYDAEVARSVSGSSVSGSVGGGDQSVGGGGGGESGGEGGDESALGGGGGTTATGGGSSAIWETTDDRLAESVGMAWENLLAPPGPEMLDETESLVDDIPPPSNDEEEQEEQIEVGIENLGTVPTEEATDDEESEDDDDDDDNFHDEDGSGSYLPSYWSGAAGCAVGGGESSSNPSGPPATSASDDKNNNNDKSRKKSELTAASSCAETMDETATIASHPSLGTDTGLSDRSLGLADLEEGGERTDGNKRGASSSRASSSRASSSRSRSRASSGRSSSRRRHDRRKKSKKNRSSESGSSKMKTKMKIIKNGEDMSESWRLAEEEWLIAEAGVKGAPIIINTTTTKTGSGKNGSGTGSDAKKGKSGSSKKAKVKSKVNVHSEICDREISFGGSGHDHQLDKDEGNSDKNRFGIDESECYPGGRRRRNCLLCLTVLFVLCAVAAAAAAVALVLTDRSASPSSDPTEATDASFGDDAQFGESTLGPTPSIFLTGGVRTPAPVPDASATSGSPTFAPTTSTPRFTGGGEVILTALPTSLPTMMAVDDATLAPTSGGGADVVDISGNVDVSANTPEPTGSPATTQPITDRPTPKPTRRPTNKPTRRPTPKPTRRPTKEPTTQPPTIYTETLCSDGSQVSYPDRRIPFGFTLNGQPTTCGAVSSAITSIFENDEDDFRLDVLRYYSAYCGCPPPSDEDEDEPAVGGACTFCPYGSAPPSGDRITPIHGDSCSDLHNFVESTFTEIDCIGSSGGGGKDNSRLAGLIPDMHYCGCFGAEQPECSLCDDNDDGGGSTEMAYPDRTIPSQTLAGEAVTCEVLSSYADVFVEQGSGSCDADVQVYAGYCGCIPQPVGACTLCGGEDSESNSFSVPDPDLRLPDGVGSGTCGDFERYVSFFGEDDCQGELWEDLRGVAAYCGCPGAEPVCSLCPGAVGVPDPDMPSLVADYGSGNGRTSCGDLDELVSTYSASRCEDERVSIARNGVECACPGMETGACTLCPDGSRPTKPYTVVNTDAGDILCRDLDFLVSTFTEAVCDINQEALQPNAALCGCPDVDFPCTLCPDGSVPPSPNLKVDGDRTCRDVHEEVLRLTKGECDNIVEDLDVTAYQCNCPGAQPTCTLCPDGSPPPDPNKQALANKSCGDVHDILLGLTRTSCLAQEAAILENAKECGC